MADGVISVSVIVAAYKAASTLKASIASIQAQTVRDLEILIVDDCSPDDTRAVADAIAAQDARVRVIACPVNGGPGAARNAGLGAARGEWIAVVDADDEILPERFAAMLAAGNGADIVFDNLIYVTAGSADTSRPYIAAALHAEGPLTLARFIQSHRRSCPVPNLGFLKPLIRRAAIEKSGVRYDTSLKIGEDAMLIFDLMAQGATARLLPDAYYRYFRHEGSISARQGVESIAAINRSYRDFRARFANLQPEVTAMLAALIRDNERRIDASAGADDLAKGRADKLLRRLAADPGSAKFLAREIGSRLKRRRR